LSLGATSGNALTITQRIDNGLGIVRVAAGSSGGAGVLTIGGTSNTWGATELNNASSGVLRMGVVNALPTATTLTFGTTPGNGDSNVELRGFNTTIGQLTNGLQSGGILRNTSATAATLTISGSDTTAAAFSGAIEDGTGDGALALVRSGSGKTILGGTNSYTGTTTIDGGILVVNGSLASGSAVTVTSGGTLGGTGTVSGTVAAKSGGIVGPGNSPGVLTTGAASFESGSIFSWELNNNMDGDTVDAGDTGTRGLNYDGLTSSSLAVASGAIFRVVLADTAILTNAFWDQNQTWTDIFSVSGATTSAALNQLFNSFEVFNGTTNITETYSLEGTFAFTGSTLTWTAVPEPSSALAGLLIAAGLLRRRRVA
jgi:autotransporter-associated beta strand protein